MNHEQALKAIEWNPAGVIEALEALEWECPRCAGNGIKLSGGVCPRCDGNKKIHYSHTLQVGEWVLYKNKVALIVGTYFEAQRLVYGVSDVKIFNKYYDLLLQIDPSGLVPPVQAFIKDCTSIPEWEEIQKILEKAGILLRLRETPSGWMPPTKFYCDIAILHRDAAQVKEFISLSVADSRIKAVYDAVLKLGKKIN